ncbi:MAG: hypothetical protein ACREP1_11705 [Rhodanobacteraceae bacterium]
MRRAHSFSIVLLTALLGLAACHREPAAPPNTTPEGAVRADLVLTRNGDFDGLLRSTLPIADYQAWRKEWEQAKGQQPAPTAQQRAQFAQMMQKLTEPGAEDKLYKQLQPQLADFRKQHAKDMPMLIGILQAAGNNIVQNSAELSASQKQQATEALTALAAWAQTADFTDAAKAKQAIGVICDTARKLDLKTLDQLRVLDYAQTMKKYGEGWDGLKHLLKIYGLDLDASFDGARVETLSHDAAHARVRETFVLAGKPIVSEVNLVRQGGHWYDADRLAAWRKRHETTSASSAIESKPATPMIPPMPAPPSGASSSFPTKPAAATTAGH